MTTTLPVDERMLRAGVGLSAGAIQWGQRPQSPARVGLTTRDLRLMRLLHDTNYLSASQLTLLGWGTAERAAQERLKRLHDTGYLDRFRPLAARGTCEWNYRLTRAGWEALVANEMAADDRHYTPAEITSVSYTEHDLQLAAIVLLIATSRGHNGIGRPARADAVRLAGPPQRPHRARRIARPSAIWAVGPSR